MRGNHFLVHGHKKDLPYITCIFHLLKYVVKICLVSAILHHISLLRLLPKSYFFKVLFNPIFCALAPLKLDFLSNQKSGDSLSFSYYLPLQQHVLSNLKKNSSAFSNTLILLIFHRHK